MTYASLPGVFVATALSLFTVIGAPEVALAAQEDMSFPTSWGALSGAHLDGSNCPALDGTYSTQGWTYQLKNGEEELLEEMPIKASALIHSSERVFNDALSKTELPKDRLFIHQTNSGSFTLSIFNEISPNSVVSAEFNQANGKLECSGKWWIVTDSKPYQGGTEGYALDITSTRYFSRLANSDLVVHIKNVVKRTDWLIFKKTNTFDTFYRLKRHE